MVVYFLIRLNDTMHCDVGKEDDRIVVCLDGYMYGDEVTGMSVEQKV